MHTEQLAPIMFNDKPIEIPTAFTRSENWDSSGGWQDVSYRNDLAARAELELTSIADGPRLRVWVAEKEPSEREYWATDEHMPRFVLEYLDSDASEGSEVARSEDDADLEVWVRAGLLARAIQGSKTTGLPHAGAEIALAQTVVSWLGETQ